MFDFSNHEIDQDILNDVLSKYASASAIGAESGVYFEGQYYKLSNLSFYSGVYSGINEVKEYVFYGNAKNSKNMSFAA